MLAARKRRRLGVIVAVLLALNVLVWVIFPDWRLGLMVLLVSLLVGPVLHTMLVPTMNPEILLSDHLELLPAVDIADGQAVQLVQGVAGSEKRFGDPIEAALRWQEAGAEWIHLVDLDAAFGRGENRELLARIVGTLDIDVEMSGGIRDDDSLAAAMAAGCRRVNIGTAALEQPEWCARGDRADTVTGSLSGSTYAGRRSPRAAGPARAATSTRCSSGSTPRAAPATSSPT